jgi:glycerol dehydrogenase-like iron-containing ADH family enzyme
MAEVASQAPTGPRKYSQGRGVIGSLGEHVGDLGKDALVVAADAFSRADRQQSGKQPAAVPS